MRLFFFLSTLGGLFEQRAFGASSEEGLVLRAIEEFQQENPPILLQDMYLAIDLPLGQAAPIDTDLDYSFAGVSYARDEVEPTQRAATKLRLERLSSLPVTACYQITGTLVGVLRHWRCRYLRDITIDSEALQTQIAGLFGKPNAGAKQFDHVWIEAGTRVSSRGAPLGKISTVRPVALSIGDSLFLVYEQLAAPQRFMKQHIVEGSLAFKFMGSDAGSTDSASRLRDIFVEELQKQFAKPPLLVELDLSEKQADAALIFKRWNAKSNVVGRESFVKWDWWNSTYERSTLIVHWNCDSNCREIRVDIQQTLFFSADNREYDERRWDMNQIQFYGALYRKAATESYLNVLRSTCSRLNGRGLMSGQVCRIRGVIQ